VRRVNKERRYHHGELREALLRAAEELLEECGLDAFTLREAARRAGVSPAAPKHHFGDVKGLLTEIAIGSFQLLAHQLELADKEGGSPKERLLLQGHAYVRFAIAHPARFDLMFRRSRIDPTSPKLGQASSAAIGALQRVIADVPQVPAGDGALLIWSTVHGFARLLLDGQFTLLAGNDLDAFIREKLESAIAIV
jgi:AcrR family transcriptional regulator